MKPSKIFLARQVNQIGQEGWTAVKRKGILFVGMCLAFVPVFVVRLLRPLVLIRFGKLTSERIGHFIHDIEFYLCEREVGRQEAKALDLFCFGNFVSNSQIKIMCKRTLPTFGFVKYMHRVNRMFPGSQVHTVSLNNDGKESCRDIHGLLQRTKVHLTLTPEEERRGQAALRQWGVPEGARFVCFHARDSAYLNAIMPRENWSYNDYRDSNIHQYIPAVEALSKREIYSFRMGAVVKEKILSDNPKIIDYANQGRTDFLDIYLSARCYFFLASSSGIDSVAMANRRPIVYVNVIPFEYLMSWDPQNVILPKKIWDLKSERFLTFREILESGAGQFCWSEQYRARGLRPVENSPEEITAAVVEMYERLNGSWKSTDGDDKLQERFWSLFKSSEYHGRFLSHVSAAFLRQNRNLLD